MWTEKQFSSLLSSEKILIIDGALATELEIRGHDLNHPLWSAKILQENANSIKNVHLDYYLAGADVATTASYQATHLGLIEHFQLTHSESISLIEESVHAARRARDTAYARGVDPSRTLLVAGSVGPYGAYLADGSEYRGDYTRSPAEFQDFHRPRIQALIQAGADLLAIETIPSLPEIEALLNLLGNEFPGTIAWLGITTRDSTHLSDGTDLAKVLAVIHESRVPVVAFGVNCVPLDSVPDTLRYLSQHTQLPLLAYPNSGEVWDATTNTWSGVQPDDVLSSASTASEGGSKSHNPTALWIQNGARVIGGCCRTGPAFITSIRKSLKARQG